MEATNAENSFGQETNDKKQRRQQSEAESPRRAAGEGQLVSALDERSRKMNQRAETGKIVVRAKETPWMQNRNAKVRYYFMPYKTDTALQTMQALSMSFNAIGKHRHQGGLAIFVLEGAGYTVVDGSRYDWKAGDLILLPIKPGGVSHQHFNADPKSRPLACALITNTYRPHLGYEIVQIEDSPDWKGSWEKSVMR
jgi:mannose-6-phosphate isomerase-like protein (cupin superfamily)